MKSLTSKPSLGFSEAVKLSLSKLTCFEGRSRRSEFWWFMLAFVIASSILNFIVGMILPELAVMIINFLFWGLALGVTSRRLQDRGVNKLWVIISWLASIAVSIYSYTSGITAMAASVNPDIEVIIEALKNPVFMILNLINIISGIAVIIFCMLDGTAETNKYGESPKYIVEDDKQE